MNLAEFPQIQSLSAREKLELVEEIWKSASDEADFLDVSTEEKQLLDERWTSYLASPESALTVEQFKDQLKRLRG